MSSEPLIALAWGSPGGPAADIFTEIEALIGRRPALTHLMGLDGPNESIQILLSHEDWILIAKAVIAIYGAEIVKEAAKSTWKAAAPKFAKASETVRGHFGRLVTAISSARLYAKAPVILGFPRTPVGARRHIGIEILDAQPENIARAVSLLAQHGAEIEDKLNDWDRDHSHYPSLSYEENSDCSVKLKVSDLGTIQIKATVWNGSGSAHESIICEFRLSGEEEPSSN